MFRHSTSPYPRAWLNRKLAGIEESFAVRTYLCFARSVWGVARLKKWYLILNGHKTPFGCKGLFRSGVFPVGGDIESGTDLHEGLIFDVLTYQGTVAAFPRS